MRYKNILSSGKNLLRIQEVKNESQHFDIQCVSRRNLQNNAEHYEQCESFDLRVLN